MERNISGTIRVVKMIGHHLAEVVLLNYINRAKNHGFSSSKTRFIHLGLNDNTPILQYSNTLACLYRHSQFSLTTPKGRGFVSLIKFLGYAVVPTIAEVFAKQSKRRR
jgi:hypothetical protein